MKKADILAENQQVLFAIDKFEKFTQNANDISSKRLRSCNVIVYENEKYYYLQSYRTIIAFIEKESNTLVDFLRYVYGYTATSAQHISKFDKDYCNKGLNYWGCTNRLTYRDK